MVDLLLSIFITLRYFRRGNHFVYNNDNNNGGDDIHNNNVQHGTK